MEPVKLGQLLDETAQRDAIHVAIAPVVAGERLAPGVHVGFLDDSKSDAVGTDAEPIGIVDPFLLRPVEKGQRFYLCLYPQTVTSLRHEWTHPAFGQAAPYKPATLKPGPSGPPWRTENVVALCRKIREEDDRESLGILADALEEAGYGEDRSEQSNLKFLRECKSWDDPRLAIAMVESDESSAAADAIESFGHCAGLAPNRVLEKATDYLDNGDYIHNGENESYKDADWDAMWKAYETITGRSVPKDERGWFFSCSC